MFKQLLLLALCLSATNVFAGFHYTATTTTQSSNGNHVTKVEAWIEGGNAKIVFIEAAGNPMAQDGSYIITTDGGKTMFLVNPKEETYMEWDMDQMFQMASDVMESMGGLMDFEITDPEVKLLEQGPGDKVQGYSTAYVKYRTAYDMQMRVLGMKQVHSYDTIQEMWTTDALTDEAFGAWLRTRPPAMKDSDLDRLIQAEMSKIKGFPLKTVTVTNTKQWNRKKTKVKDEQTTTSTMEVTSLKKVSVAASTFEIPANYTKTELGGGASEDEKGESPFKNLFKRN